MVNERGVVRNLWKAKNVFQKTRIKKAFIKKKYKQYKDILNFEKIILHWVYYWILL